MTTLVIIQNNLGRCISFRTFLFLVYDILGDFWSSFMTTLVAMKYNVCHCTSCRRSLVVVYDIMGDCRSLFMPTLVVIQNNLVHYMSLGHFWLSFMTFWETFGPRL